MGKLILIANDDFHNTDLEEFINYSWSDDHMNKLHFSDLNPDDTNNVCILTPELLGFKSTGLLVANGVLGTTVAQTTATANNMTQIEKVDPEVVIGGTTYNSNDDIISLCRHNSDKKTCKQVDSCKTTFDGAYENDAALRRDIRKIAENALQYHGPSSPYTTAADQLAAAFDAALAGA